MTATDKLILGAALVLSVMLNCWLAGHVIGQQEAMDRVRDAAQKATEDLARAHALLAKRRRP